MNHSLRITCYNILSKDFIILKTQYRYLSPLSEQRKRFGKSSAMLPNVSVVSPVKSRSNCEKTFTNQSSCSPYSPRLSSQLSDNFKDTTEHSSYNAYQLVIKDLNKLQSNSISIALAKYNEVDKILPLFKTQLSEIVDIKDLDKLNVIHVAGTKGKGSTCAFIESILQEYGLKTGFYNSPHLIKVTERIRINRRSLDNTKFVKYFRFVYDKLYQSCIGKNLVFPSYFSFLTILSFYVFLQEKVDCAIVEVGIGGEYDPTNVVEKPIVCGITTLDLDHTNILGSTIEQIAHTKAGIAKTGVPLFCCEQEYPKTIEVIKSRADALGCPFHVCSNLNEVFEHNKYELGIAGSVQSLNASLASNIAHFWLSTVRPGLLKEARYYENKFIGLPVEFRKGLQACCWPGRCEMITDHVAPNIKFFIDGAHTKSSMINCENWFSTTSDKLNKNSIKILIINVIGTRDRHQVLEPLAKKGNIFKMIIFSTNKLTLEDEDSKSDNFTKLKHDEKAIENAQNNRAIWEELILNNRSPDAEFTSQTNLVFASVQETIDFARKMATNDCVEKEFHFLVTGSLHFVGAVKDFLSCCHTYK